MSYLATQKEDKTPESELAQIPEHPPVVSLHGLS